MGKGETSANDLIRAPGEGAIVVAVQYRLGLFGFLSGQAVKGDGELNVGLRPCPLRGLSIHRLNALQLINSSR